MAENLDLLGDPLVETWRGRGRPPHQADGEKRNRVMLLLAMGWEELRIAAALGVSRSTLRKHYKNEFKVRDEARARLEAHLIGGMAAKALAGDVPAYREIRRALEKADELAAQGVYRAAASAPKLGKKEERQAAADRVDGLFAPGPPPEHLTH